MVEIHKCLALKRRWTSGNIGEKWNPELTSHVTGRGKLNFRFSLFGDTKGISLQQRKRLHRCHFLA